MYDLKAYGEMMSDRVRMDAYAEALRRAVKPGCVVLDIGTGTGIFAMLACRFGARRVYAVEPNNVIEVARIVAAANGYAERIEFIQRLTTGIDLPERADVVVADLRGVLPCFYNNISTMIDARDRHLADGGVLIPQQDTLWVAVIEAPGLYREKIGAWDECGLDFDWTAARRMALNQWMRGTVLPEQLLLDAQCWATLDYRTVADHNARGNVSWTVVRAGTAHGLCVWFDAELAPGVGFSNAPETEGTIHGRAYFPLEFPVDLAPEDTVTVTLQAHRIGEDYVWIWRTLIQSPETVKADFRQSTFYGAPQVTAKLHKRDPNHAPVLDDTGRSDRLILSLMDGINTIDEIARQAADQFPQTFKSPEHALERVRDLSQLYDTGIQNQ